MSSDSCSFTGFCLIIIGFTFGLPLPLFGLGFAPLNGGGISASSLSTECTICEYRPGTVAPVATKGSAGVGGLHLHIICSSNFALSSVSA